MATAIASLIHPPSARCRLGRVVIRPLLVLAALAAGLAPAAETWMALGRLGRAPASLYGVRAIAVGYQFVVAVRLDGTVVAWGMNESRQTTVPAELTGVVAVAAGVNHVLALKADGTVVAWGNNSGGQTTVPDGLSNVVSIAANDRVSMALKRDGTVVGWGDNAYGQTSIPSDLTGVVGIALGLKHAVAIKSDGTVVTWGANSTGLLAVPAGLNGVTAVTAGDAHTVALKADGTVVAWGKATEAAVPSGLSGVRSIAGNHVTTLAAKTDGTVVAWGAGSSEDYGIANQVADLNGVIAVAVDYYHGVALRADGTLAVVGGMRGPSIDLRQVTQISCGTSGEEYAAARTAAGAVAVWGEVSRVTAGAIPSGLTTIAAVAAGSRSVQALTVDGTVMAWGNDASATVPAGLTGVIALSAGVNHVLGLKADGTVSAWGTISGLTVSNLSGVTGVAAGGGFSLIQRSDGTVVAFGSNNQGESTVPTGLNEVVAVAAGNAHGLALRRDGSVMGWGSDSSNQATPPSGLTTVVAIAAGMKHSLALRQDGTVAAWGRTDEGAISVPADVTGVTAIAAGGYSSWLRLSTRPANPVTIANRSALYDGTPKSVSVTTANGRRPTRVTYNGSDALPSAIGIYTVVAEADYMDSYGSSTAAWTIVGEAQTISFPVSPMQVYGAAPLSFATYSSVGLPVSYSVVSGPGTMNGTVLTITGAGTIRVLAEQEGNGIYAAVQATQDITVAKATLRVTADRQWRLVGGINPILTATMSGYVNGETASVVTGSPVLNTTATATSAVGTYPITVNVSAMSAPNYDIVGVNGSLVVSTTPPPSASGGGGGGGGCGIGSSLGLLLAPLLAALRFWRRRERVG